MHFSFAQARFLKMFFFFCQCQKMIIPTNEKNTQQKTKTLNHLILRSILTGYKKKKKKNYKIIILILYSVTELLF